MWIYRLPVDMTKRQNILRKCHVLHVPYRQLIPKKGNGYGIFSNNNKNRSFFIVKCFPFICNETVCLREMMYYICISIMEEVCPMENSLSQNTLICPCRMYTLLKEILRKMWKKWNIKNETLCHCSIDCVLLLKPRLLIKNLVNFYRPDDEQFKLEMFYSKISPILHVWWSKIRV